MNHKETKFVCLNCLIELKQHNGTLKDLGDNLTHVFCDKCGLEGVEIDISDDIPEIDLKGFPISRPIDGDKIEPVTVDNMEEWGIEEIKPKSKNMVYNINGVECMLVQATPNAQTVDIFIDGKYSGVLAVRDIMDGLL